MIDFHIDFGFLDIAMLSDSKNYSESYIRANIAHNKRNDI